MRSRRVALLVSLALLVGSALAAQLPPAGAQSSVETNVILIEVDGLEPKDVTPQTTPFLWELAHPQSGQLIEDSRAGWTWEAPRSVMTAGTAANAAALLTGGYPEQIGAPADEFMDPTTGDSLRLEYQGDKETLVDGALQLRNQDLTGRSLLGAVPFDTESQPGGKKLSAAFVGNPALSGIADEAEIPDSLKWWPTSEDPDAQSPPSPAYCDLPRRPPEDPTWRPPCSATDLVTLDHAVSALGSPAAQGVVFTYIQLAELGVIKRRDGDVSNSEPPTEQSSPEAIDSVPHQLAQTDAAIAQFVTRYKDSTQSPVTADKWANTVIFVVGSHGYETSTPDKRLPAPDGQVGLSNLESYVEESGLLQYSPYGSMATIHATSDDPQEQREALETIEDELRPGGDLDDACGEPCIDRLLYVREDALPPGLDQETREQMLLSEAHPDWHLDHLDAERSLAPSRRSGELVLTTKPGWGAAAAIPTTQTQGAGSQLPISDTPDPYIGVAGGPRNRAVAAIVNGPGGEIGVRQIVPDRYPVTTAPDTGELQGDPERKYTSAAEANANPEDDTGAPGHERQPETVDFAPTIAALLGIGIDSEQLAGRFLQEAFLRELKFPELEELEEPPPPPVEEEVIVEPPQEVIVLPPPPPPPVPPPPATWKYNGLLKGLHAAVGDGKGRVFPRVPHGAKLDYLILKADFGQPLSAVKLSFYKKQRRNRSDQTSKQRRRAGSAAAGDRRTVVKTLATFDAFSIKRARQAKLTLKVPDAFAPTHVGVVVQRARALNRREQARASRKREKGKAVPDFKVYGARVGGIYRVRHARWLHKLVRKRPHPRGKKPKSQGRRGHGRNSGRRTSA